MGRGESPETWGPPGVESGGFELVRGPETRDAGPQLEGFALLAGGSNAAMTGTLAVREC